MDSISFYIVFYSYGFIYFNFTSSLLLYMLLVELTNDKHFQFRPVPISNPRYKWGTFQLNYKLKCNKHNLSKNLFISIFFLKDISSNLFKTKISCIVR